MDLDLFWVAFDHGDWRIVSGVQKSKLEYCLKPVLVPSLFLFFILKILDDDKYCQFLT